ncbi:bifunctional diguanylate cyclase/phosphodiesterase [Methylophilus aquaticus]|uniref:EAL domain-containing protein n=1 Tax=Methylophilus aquaticus TaxID=1971610 RepID=A0ABT9JVW8_9PROT|nr:EAL domain-containing protein [Methylophilus aquaticus]MDP8568286.1 EAL domain-containing protein [Methylophilus aquaticus]
MKHYTLLKKMLLPLVALGMVIGLLSFAYTFNQHLQNIETKAREETSKISNLLTTARTLVGEHVLSSMALLKQYSSSQGYPTIKGTTRIVDKDIPNLFFGQTPQTADNRLINFVTQIGNGTATIFVKHGKQFIRVATNVKKADGSNAFGTELDPKGKAIKNLLDGRTFYGVVDILGESYLSRYEPMYDAQGKLIGAWYVGYKLDVNALDQAIRQWGFLEKGFVAVTDHHDQIRFLTQGIRLATAENALKSNHGWKIVTQNVPEWDFQINILYPSSEAYWSGLGALSPLIIILLIVSFVVLLAIYSGLRRFVLNPIGGEPDTAKQLLMRIERGDFTEDDTQAEPDTLIANMLKMRQRLREMVSEIQGNANRLKVSASVFEHAHDAIFITDAQGNIVQCNPSFSVITGYVQPECIGQSPQALGLACHTQDFFKPFFSHPSARLEWKGEVWNRHSNGFDYLAEMELSPVMNQAGEFQHYVGLFSDITRAKEQQNMLEHMAYHDALTQLPNRVLFSSRLQQALIQAEQQQSLVAICYIDLDEFKIVNDQHGHEYGDKLLVMLSQRICTMLKENDTLARIGGDEFALLLCGYRSHNEYTRLLKKLLAAIEKPFMVNTLKFSISASIGYTLFPTDRHPPDTLLRHADHAMYHAKTQGGHQYHMFDLASAQQSQQQQALFKDLLNAIQQNQLRLVYQPQICVKSGKVFCFEALLRWQHPTRGLLNPHDFLSIIEHTSLIIDVGNWVIEESLRQLAEWQMQGLETQVSVNIAAHHLMQKNFARQLAKFFKRYPAISPQHLHLEITESAAISDFARVNRVIQQCHAMGVSFSIDDFGSGYSSLIYLRRLPVDIIKIDQSFVHNMLTNQEDMAVVRSVITLCREFDRKVVAEGVEKAEQARILRELGCDFAQGYGISRGLSSHKVVEWMQKNNPYTFD